MKKWKPEKAFGAKATAWWDEFSIDKQKQIKAEYEALRIANAKKKFPYPDMADLSNLKIRELSQKQVYCIFRFHNHYSIQSKKEVILYK